MSKNRMAPPIRFQGFTEPWKQRKLGELLIERIEKSPKSDKYPLMAFIANQGVAPKGDRYDRSALVNDTENKLYKRTELGDFIYSSNNLETGSIGLNKYGNATISPVYSVFKSTRIADSDFIGRRLVRKDFINEMVKWRQGVIYGQWKIHEEDFLKIDVIVPLLDEQREIGSFLDCLDNLITLHQRKLEQQKKLKKYFLQNMFPAKGENVPRIRFKGFTGDWEQRKFGEIAEYKKGPFGSALKKDFFIPDSATSVKVYEQQNAINKNWNLSRYYISKEYAQKLKSFEVHAGDIIVSCAGTIGEIYELPAQSRSGIINQALMRIRVNEDIVCKDIFKLAFSNMIDSFSREFSNGSAIKNIPPFADLKPMKILLPNKAEQTIIGDFFTDIDKTITLHQRKIDQLQAMKKFMLQNLFV